MRWFATPLLAVLLFGLVPNAVAQPRPDEPRREDQRQDPRWRARDPSPEGPRYSRGDRLPEQYRREEHAAPDWRARNLSPAPRGYQWYCPNGRDCFLVRTTTGTIRESRWRDDREDTWRRRYTRGYSYHDDYYYRECRDRPDPGEVLIRGLIGGLIVHAIDRDADVGAVFTGIIIASVVGDLLTRDMDCDDRSYAYATYHRALNSGRTGAYRWRNPRNNHFGDFNVRNFFFDRDGFRCANYRHVAHVGRERRHDGRACRQPDGAWVFLD